MDKNEYETTTNDLSASRVNEDIIQLWYALQKIIKEKITLYNIINKQEQSDKEFIFQKFAEHYKYKLEARQRTENLKFREKKVDIDYNEIFQVDALNEITAPVKNFLFLIKSNYEYILKIVDLIDLDSKFITEEHREGIAHLLCHQFYNNIQIPNPEQEELLVLCYHLLQKEINNLAKASVYDFLEEKSSFTGKFINCLMQKYEIKNFLSLSFGDLIQAAENDKNKFLDLNLTRLSYFFKRTLNGRNTITFDSIDPTKTLNSFIDEKLGELTHRKIEILHLGKRSQSLDSRIVKLNQMEIEEGFFGVDNYAENISVENVLKAYEKEDDRNMKQYYLKLSEEMAESPKKYFNDRFREYLRTFDTGANDILGKYIFCVFKVLENIEKMLKMLSDKVSIIPYMIRCLAKIIFIFVSKRFPKLTAYEVDGFIGKFFFEIYILPIIDNSYFNTEKTNTFLSNTTKNLIKYIRKIISKIDSCSLFNQYIEPDYTVLNHYLIKIMPFFHKFYQTLINIKLPRIIENLLAQNENQKKNEQCITYDYFNEHPLELFRYQCICFSMKDIKFMMTLLKNHMDEFKGFPNYNSFEKAIQKIINSKTYNNYKAEKESKKFYMACKEEENVNKTSLKRTTENDKKKLKEKDLLYLVKQSISKILKGLNMICSNEYSYFNTVTSTEDFFEELTKTLEDLNDLQDGDITKIPLSWYSTYLNANKLSLPAEYIEKDYTKLYQELLEEENNNLEDLKSYISLIFISSGMNLRFAEGFTENSKRELQKIILVERYKKIDDFMRKSSIEVCYTVNKKYSEEDQDSKIILRTSVNCIHYKFENLNKITDSRVLKNKQGSTKENHPKTIEDFIKRIRKDSSILSEDINSGRQKFKIYKTFADYMGFVKLALKNDPNFSGANEEELQKIMDIIKNHIIKKLYPYIFPVEPSNKDIEFQKKTKELAEFIEPEDLFIKDINKTEINSAVKYIHKLEKSNSSIDKINCVLSILNTLNICIKFSTGKDEDGGADNLTPLLHYTIIKAVPERFYSNIYFMKAFISETENGVASFTITQLEHAAQYISTLDVDTLAERR